MTNAIEFKCRTCGGEEIVWGATVKWDKANQCMEPGNNLEGAYCDNCEADIDPVQVDTGKPFKTPIILNESQSFDLLCLFEIVSDCTLTEHETKYPNINRLRSDIGIAELRDLLIKLTPALHTLYNDHMTDDERELFVPFDYDFVPWFVDLLETTDALPYYYGRGELVEVKPFVLHLLLEIERRKEQAA
ncbi:hypothetical protein [Maritalea porphyrae]|uniref:hypothetical protein n=1 Tax=Maritalea porphyrae TaxID=880732 RepID=UPI0022AEFF00|nr:hypothetical protein [Maritalea porphyrae]MCZ4270746.1 hypothetical protein [Maritalea porphyrae]